MRTPIRTLAAVAAGATALLGAQLGLATSAHAATSASISLSVPNPGVLTIGRPATITTHLTGNSTPHNGELTFVIDGLSVLKASDFTLTTSTGVNIPLSNGIPGDAVDVVGSIAEGGGYLPANSVKSSSFVLTAKNDAASPVRGELIVYVEFESTDDSVQVENQGATLQVPKATPYTQGSHVAVVRKDSNGLPDIYYAKNNATNSTFTEVVPSPDLAAELGTTSTVVGGDVFGSGDDYPVYYKPGTGSAQSTFYIVDGFSTVNGVVEASDWQQVLFGVSGDIPLTGAFPIPSSSALYPYGSFDTIAVWRPGNQHFYVDGGSSAGLKFGLAGDIPVVGNWTGTRDSDADQGGDGVGVFRPGNHTWYLLNQAGKTMTQSFGVSGDKPVVGNWNSNGVSTIGVRRGTTYYLAKTNTSAAYNTAFSYGLSTDGTIGAYTFTGGDAAAVGAAYPGQNPPGTAHAVSGRLTRAHADRVLQAATRAVG